MSALGAWKDEAKHHQGGEGRVGRSTGGDGSPQRGRHGSAKGEGTLARGHFAVLCHLVSQVTQTVMWV